MNRSISSRPEPPEGPRIGPDLDLAPTLPCPLLYPYSFMYLVQSPHALPYASEWIPTAFGPISLGWGSEPGTRAQSLGRSSGSGDIMFRSSRSHFIRSSEQLLPGYFILHISYNLIWTNHNLVTLPHSISLVAITNNIDQCASRKQGL
ncbi:uncharacterized protein BDR25DRAFT_357051 [Lindgomyces ingoldianus]|uniref:Uncharacterized protein n=1 Tax=Lindgomyces ingoldianus TaxID=673940 RepID=A0ACB6QP49_9PLEO|nr:uncharacterized protein BDR25DRAFT_357051 [Lindgomyces ingoldianus]KAF2468691.1 hypothetical protein BDR25DRAFT_357051 [Lindgomyces ingoldianus]